MRKGLMELDHAFVVSFTLTLQKGHKFLISETLDHSRAPQWYLENHDTVHFAFPGG